MAAQESVWSNALNRVADFLKIAARDQVLIRDRRKMARQKWIACRELTNLTQEIFEICD